MPTYEFKHFGKGKTAYEALFLDRRGEHELIENWIDDQSKTYLDKEYDSQYISEIFWNMHSLRLIDIFRFEQIDIESFPEEFNREDIQKLIVKYKHNEQVHHSLLQLSNLFNEHLNNKREEIARERAVEDCNYFFPFERKGKKPSNEDVAEFFGVELVIEGVYDYADELQKNESCVICPHCDNAIENNELIGFTEAYKYTQPDCYICPSCEEVIHKSDISSQTQLSNSIKLKLVI